MQYSDDNAELRFRRLFPGKMRLTETSYSVRQTDGAPSTPSHVGMFRRSQPFFERMSGWQFNSLLQGGGWFQAPSMRIGIHGGDTSQLYVFFEVPDLERAIAGVVEAGGEADPPMPEEPGFGRMAFCRDPQGVRFGLHQPTCTAMGR